MAALTITSFGCVMYKLVNWEVAFAMKVNSVIERYLQRLNILSACQHCRGSGKQKQMIFTFQ
jgi:hypothetical protein